MWLKKILERIRRIFRRRTFHLALYGPPNGGKTTLANRICADWLGEEMGPVSAIAHETRRILTKERIMIVDEEGRQIVFSLVDTPGLSTRIDYEDFVAEGVPEAEAKLRAKEAAGGVLESVSWLKQADGVVVVLDATKEPRTQVNATLLESLEERGIPHFILANKMDLREANSERVQTAFPEKEVLFVSAKAGDNMEAFYARIAGMVGG